MANTDKKTYYSLAIAHLDIFEFKHAYASVDAHNSEGAIFRKNRLLLAINHFKKKSYCIICKQQHKNYIMMMQFSS